MAVRLDQSLYTKLNAETQAAVNEVNAEAQRILPTELWEGGEWGCQTTLRQKQDYLAYYKRQVLAQAESEQPKTAGEFLKRYDAYGKPRQRL